MQSKKMLISTVLAGTLLWAGAFASAEEMPSSGYPGWGPVANLETPYSPNESATPRYDEEMRDRAQHVAEVAEARDRVWIANAPFREPFLQQGVAEARPSVLLTPFRQLARRLNAHEGERSVPAE